MKLYVSTYFHLLKNHFKSWAKRMLEKSPFALNSASPCFQCPIKLNIDKAKFNISVKCERYAGEICKYSKPEKKEPELNRELS